MNMLKCPRCGYEDAALQALDLPCPCPVPGCDGVIRREQPYVVLPGRVSESVKELFRNREPSFKTPSAVAAQRGGKRDA